MLEFGYKIHHALILIKLKFKRLAEKFINMNKNYLSPKIIILIFFNEIKLKIFILFGVEINHFHNHIGPDKQNFKEVESNCIKSE